MAASLPPSLCPQRSFNLRALPSRPNSRHSPLTAGHPSLCAHRPLLLGRLCPGPPRAHALSQSSRHLLQVACAGPPKGEPPGSLSHLLLSFFTRHNSNTDSALGDFPLNSLKLVLKLSIRDLCFHNCDESANWLLLETGAPFTLHTRPRCRGACLPPARVCWPFLSPWDPPQCWQCQGQVSPERPSLQALQAEPVRLAVQGTGAEAVWVAGTVAGVRVPWAVDFRWVGRVSA